MTFSDSGWRLPKNFSSISLIETESSSSCCTDESSTISRPVTNVMVNNSDVSLQGDELQIVPEFVTLEETQQILKEVYNQKEEFLWEGFDQRRRVQRWQNLQDLPPTMQILADRIRQKLCKQENVKNTSNPFYEISFHEYHKSQMLRHLNSNKTHVTTFETPNVCLHCCQVSPNKECHCFVAVLPLTASLIENTNRPKERSVNCWDLQEPRGEHATSWVLPKMSLIVKRNGFLYKWRNRIVQILDDESTSNNSTNNNDNNTAYEEDDSSDTAVLIKFYHVPNDVMEISRAVPSPEFGFVPTPEIEAEQSRRRSVSMPPMEDLLTILVTTSPIKSNPSTELLERVFDTFPNGGHTFAYKCRKVIVCDGARQRDESTTQKYTNDKQAMRNGLVTSEQNENYALFKANLRRLCEEASQNDDGKDPPSLFFQHHSP